MGQYYFTVASLPMLFYGGDEGPDTETFLDICRESCSSEDFRLVESATLKPASAGREGNRLLNRWVSWETSLRNALVMARAKEGGRDPSSNLREENSFYTEINDIAREACGQASPLQAEEILNQARWARFEELETGHHFDTEKLMVYYLKLQLNERRAMFTKQAGEEKFSHIYESMHEIENSRETVAGEL